MLTIDEALRAVLAEVRPLPARPIPMTEALGCMLGEDIVADMDLPPFDKSIVDGYALHSVDLAESDDRWLRVGETILAGQTPTRQVAPGEAAVIMTGAPLPPRTDAVVMHEKTTAGDGRVRIDEPEVRPGQNIMPRSREMRAGQVVLTARDVLGPIGLGVLASVGHTHPRVFRPRVAIVPTGDELVEPDRVPGPSQIRNSNATVLCGLATMDRADVDSFPIAPDEPEPLREILRRALGSDVVLITGGVSAGERDLVPDVLEEIGVRRVFHKVRLKPGKPIWFGVGPERDDSPGSLVFGLPGNPVSGVVGYTLFVRPALEALAHRKPLEAVGPVLVRGWLRRPFRHRGDRPTFYPSRLRDIPGGDLPEIETLDWGGSGDLRTVATAHGFTAFPAGDRDYTPGEIVDFLPML